ncbi:MAG TPA: hypothetical protein VGB52_07305 [Actinomycetota bacterium]
MRRSILMFLVAASLAVVPAIAAQDDAGSGGDAGDTFETATVVTPRGAYEGTLDPNGDDRHDFFRFDVPEGSSMSVLVTVSAQATDPVELLDPNGIVVDAGVRARSSSASAGGVITSEGTVMRLSVHRSIGGEYRLHLRSEMSFLDRYRLCFMNCEGVVSATQDLIFGGSLPFTRTRVLLVPPSHGDLGNPLGPTAVDYLDATLRGIHGWVDAMDAFADDYPRYAYLREIGVEIEVFDGVDPIDPAGYEVIIGYVAAGPVFRGVASDADDDVQYLLNEFGLGEDVHFSGRVIALSLFGGSPRAGQVVYDFPEVSDLEIVTLHEFGHTFGLGHTTTWHPTLGPDLMNSPAPFVYGDGFAAGDGGERTAMKCLSSLNLYGMAELYSWVPNGHWQPSGGSVSAPADIPYRWYCPA